ncbi:lipid-A-disaccharide synthase [Ravibacter arvi]|uniref:Lipid-A-disaccharide synthase n=1 Tax=Ravibacter arvi TaxID=2051041 RepID=A0ABP8M7K0_9BACT
MKYYLIAGERSGDLHGSNLIKGILEKDPDAQLRGWGGDLMAAEGLELVKHYRDTAFMGFLEVARNIFTIRELLALCKEDLLSYRPDALILIDYAGFNLRIASFARQHGIRVLYYISPKVWAWNEKRAFHIRKVVDRMYVIFPFEVDFYKRFGYEVEYVGNPLMDAIAAFRPNPDFRSLNGLSGKPVVALLPGSRRQEIEGMLKTMVAVQADFPEHQFVIAAVNSLDKQLYEPFANLPGITIVFDQAYDVLHVAEAALVTSGTATLETALLKVPEVVCYRTSGISYWVAKRLIKVKFISLANLIAGREIVRELIQHELTPQKVSDELRRILPGGPERKRLLEDYEELAGLVGPAGASRKAGSSMVNWVRENNPGMQI